MGKLNTTQSLTMAGATNNAHALTQARAEVQADRNHEARAILAAQATPRTKLKKQSVSTAAGSAALQPTQFAIEMALYLAINSFDRLEKIGGNDEEWDCRGDISVELAIGIAATRLREIASGKPSSHDDFSYEWHKVGAIVDLCTKSFSRPDSHYGITLSHLNSAFAVLDEMVEMSEWPIELCVATGENVGRRDE